MCCRSCGGRFPPPFALLDAPHPSTLLGAPLTGRLGGWRRPRLIRSPSWLTPLRRPVRQTQPMTGRAGLPWAPTSLPPMRRQWCEVLGEGPDRLRDQPAMAELPSRAEDDLAGLQASSLLWVNRQMADLAFSAAASVPEWSRADADQDAARAAPPSPTCDRPQVLLACGRVDQGAFQFHASPLRSLRRSSRMDSSWTAIL